MASIKFLLQSKSKESAIYCRLSLGRKIDIKRKSGFIINSKDWSDKKGSPIQRDANDKAINLKGKLESLSVFILDQYNSEYQKGTIIDGSWLQNIIDTFHNQHNHTDQNLLIEFAKEYISNLPYKVIKGNMGVSTSTVKKYKTVLTKLEAFEKHQKKQYYISDICPNWGKSFTKYLVEVEKLSIGYTGRLLKFIKTFALEAQKEGIPTHQNLAHFKGFTTKHNPITLDFDELEMLLNTRFLNETFENAKDWLIIGCYTGQRVSDLLRMNRSMIKKIGVYDFIVITQEKTKKTVQIPLHPIVQFILEKRNFDFPKTFAKNPASNATLFNRHLKTVCKLAGINSLIQGERFNSLLKRKESGTFEKWEFLSSHTCRRSFATNFYAQEKYPTPLLMNITAHSSEKHFLEYIGKPPLDFSIQLAKIWAEETTPSLKELKII